MKTTISLRRQYCLAGISIFLIVVALIAGMAGCGSRTARNATEIRNWYNLTAIRYNLSQAGYITGDYILMNDLDANTLGYEELAGPNANGGKGWQPIGTTQNIFIGLFDGQGYKIKDLFINRPDELSVGLFGQLGFTGIVRNVGVVNVIVTGYKDVGSLVADDGGVVTNSYSTGNVSSTGVASLVGGLVGAIGDTGVLTNSYSTASVTGNGEVGGLVGLNQMGTISSCYATGSVTGNNWVGGLVGYNWEGPVSNSYSTGSVTGNQSVGGLVGASNGTVNNSFWDIETSGQATSDGGTGKNTTQMQDITTFSGAVWDIVAVANPGTRNPSYIWNIVNGVAYPFLSWQPV